MLLETDLRKNIQLVESQLHWLLGAKDSLVPATLAQVLQDDFAQADVVLHPQASHAPFISHQGDFIKQLLGLAEKLRCN
jgi:pimeloyl-[acyl-carrier protein] methyl ester esterase